MSELKESKKMKVSYSTTWVEPKTVFEPFYSPKNSPLGPQKVKNDPKIESKSNVRIERNKENESCSTTWVDPPQLQSTSTSINLNLINLNFNQPQLQSASTYINLNFDQPQQWSASTSQNLNFN